MTTLSGPTLQLPDDLRRQLEAMTAEFASRPEIRQIILFGSWAESRARADSDLDVLVVAETTDRFALAMELRASAQPIVQDRGLDIVVVAADRWDYARQVRGMVSWEADRFGVRLYERRA
jgi:predicted nucleotidyltransferase